MVLHLSRKLCLFYFKHDNQRILLEYYKKFTLQEKTVEKNEETFFIKQYCF